MKVERKTKERKGTLRLDAEICVYGKNGELEHTEHCKSWLKQFLQLLRGRIAVESEAGIKDTGGTDRTVLVVFPTTKGPFSLSIFNTQAAAASTAYGIILGTGQTAVTYSDYVIETLIAHGTGAGQLSYAAMGSTALSDITDGQQFTVTRTITNSSGGSITVNEIALYVHVIYYAYSNTYYNYADFCIERTVLGTPITIADGDSKTFEYKIKLTV